ncbi:MAG: MFS transporter [Planctomycetales bacterium]
MDGQIRLKLSVMMFLQYAIWGAWVVSLGGYMTETLVFSGVQIASIYTTGAIAAIISPLFVGYVADRFFDTEKLIAGLHLLGAALLAAAAVTHEFQWLYPLMLVYSVCYMPTIALTNSISFANIPDSAKYFPGIRVFGTWGWIVVGWLVGFVLDLPPGSSNSPIFLAAGLSAALGIFSFFLPHTPPKARQTEARDLRPVTQSLASDSRAGLGRLLADPTFLVFVVCSFLICIPLAFYYDFANAFLTETDAPYPTALQTIGQLSEVGFMASMPFFIGRLGVKRMLAIGMAAWTLRYLCFGTLSFPLVVVGLILHGVCFDFFFVASQIYVDTRVSVEQRARAQSFIAFVTMGVGMFIGGYLGGLTFDHYEPPIKVAATIVPADGKPERTDLPLPVWDLEAKKGLAYELQLDKDDAVRPEQIPESFTEIDRKRNQRTIYDRTSFVAAIRAADANGDGAVDRGEWRDAQEHRWFHIWLWPAIWAGATCAIFWFGFRERRSPELEDAMSAEAPLGAGEGPEPQVG